MTDAVVQMDSVIGRVGGKRLLTIHFVETSLMRFLYFYEIQILKIRHTDYKSVG